MALVQRAIQVTAANVEQIILEAGYKRWTLDHYREYRVRYENQNRLFYSILTTDEVTGRAFKPIVLFNDVHVINSGKITVPVVSLAAFLAAIRNI